MIAPQWLLDAKPGTARVIEGQFKPSNIKAYNEVGYNIYYLPNYPSAYNEEITVDGSQIDKFDYLFVDMDLKDEVYASKDEFISSLKDFYTPSRIVDSGGGIHVYWKVSDLDPMSYLKLSRRLMRLFKTDEAVGQIFQLMRYPGYYNTKQKENLRLCEVLLETDDVYTCEELDKALPVLSKNDEQYCDQHYNRTYRIGQDTINISDKLPAKFGKLLSENHEVKDLWSSIQDDRSKGDYRLAHVMFANGFTKEEASSVLVNTAKALNRAPVHRQNYAVNIVDKIWTYEMSPDKSSLNLSSSIADILTKSNGVLKGTPFRCHKRIDNTEHGFRLGQVIGLVAGSGVGKTAFALNMFRWFSEQNPDYHNFFVPLEQPSNEIADRWQTMAQGDTSLHDKVHIISNYDDEGNFRHLSLDEIKDYIVKWQETTGLKAGCVVIDHIGALKKKSGKDENQDLMTICHKMKEVAVKTNTLLIMQSQTSREKAGIGDLELNKDAAYGTMFFEAYCDYLITLWQPLKRCHSEDACPTVTAFKYCKIRHKKARRDIIKEDIPYFFSFDSETELMRDMNEEEKVAFNYWIAKATNKRKQDRKTELIAYISVPYKEGETVEATTISDRNSGRH